MSSVNELYLLPPDSHVCFSFFFCLACLCGGSHYRVFPSPFLRSLTKGRRFSYEVFYCVSWLSFVSLCSNQDFYLTSCTNCKETTPFIGLDLHFSLSNWHYSHGPSVYTTKYELHTAPTWYSKCWMCVQTHGILSNTSRVETIISTYCLLLYSVLPFSLLLLIFFVLAPCWVCMSVVLWVDVQTGCVWAGVPLSVHLFRGTNSGFCVQYLG